MKLPERQLPAWAGKLTVRPNDTGAVPIAPYTGSVKAQRVDPGVREIEIGPVPSITPAERSDRKGMSYVKGRGAMSGDPD